MIEYKIINQHFNKAHKIWRRLMVLLKINRIRKRFKAPSSNKIMTNKMKRGALIFVFVLFNLMLLSFFISAAESLVVMPNASSSGIQSSAEKSLSEQVVIPANLEDFTRIFFSLDNTTSIDLQTFIIYLAVWIMVLVIIKSILEFIPFFESNWKAWIGAVVLSALISTTGGLKAAAIWFFNFGKLFTKTSTLWLVFDFIILAVIFFGFSKLLKILKSKSGEEKARSIGMKTGMP
jgi:hypothetical protein